MSPTRLVALDVDGTTINHAGELSPVVRDTVREVAAAGHHIVIATGRSIVATTEILDALGIEHGYAVCSNGAVSLELDPAEASRLFFALSSTGFGRSSGLSSDHLGSWRSLM